MTQVRRPSYRQIVSAARAIHEANYLAHGEGYATAGEMKMHRDDPLACDELVIDALTATFGFEDRDATYTWIRSRL